MLLIPLLPLLGVLLSKFAARVEANAVNLHIDPKAAKSHQIHNSANCVIGNTTYMHGQTFKLDCKTQCVCENGRHACSSLCPNEQLPAPEDTISCRSPRLVEVPAHCCKMWLCENPTADVYATCHNASSTPWTSCSQSCGMGISTRFTSTTTGCRELSNLRLCENRKCDFDNNILPLTMSTKNLKMKKNNSENHKINNNNKNNGSHHSPLKSLLTNQSIKDIKNNHDAIKSEILPEHRIRKGHECRSIQRLGPARVRIGSCVSRKLYRPKLCGRCHHASKCCVPSVSSTIQVELLCPINSEDPINLVRKTQQEQQKTSQLWDTESLEPIDQEYLQSHQIAIENKFIAVEWILKCDCNRNTNCNQTSSRDDNNKNENNNKKIKNNNNKMIKKVFDKNSSRIHENRKKLNKNNRKNHNRKKTQLHSYQREQHDVDDEDDDDVVNVNDAGKTQKHITNRDNNNNNNNYKNNQKNKNKKKKNIYNNHLNDYHYDDSTSTALSDEQLPDIIPYPTSSNSVKNKKKHITNVDSIGSIGDIVDIGNIGGTNIQQNGKHDSKRNSETVYNQNGSNSKIATAKRYYQLT